MVDLRERNKNVQIVCCVVLLALLLIAWSWIFYNECVTQTFASDVSGHVKIALESKKYSFAFLFINLLYGGNPSSAVGPYLLFASLSLSCVLELFTCATLIHVLFPSLNKYVSFITAALSTLIGPWLIPYLQTGLYNGAINGNVLHNITMLYSRPWIPLALIGFFSCLDRLHDRLVLKEWLCFSVFLLISTLIKPTLAFDLLPLMLLLLIVDFIKSRGRNFRNEFFFGLGAIPAGLACIYQATVIYPSAESAYAAAIIFVCPSKRELAQLFLITVRSFAFPLFIFGVAFFKRKLPKNIFLYCLMIAFSILQGVFLKESGIRYTHGNMWWSALTLHPILFAMGIGALFSCYSGSGDAAICDSKRERAINIALLAGHLIFGCIYLVGTAMGNGYYW